MTLTHSNNLSKHFSSKTKCCAAVLSIWAASFDLPRLATQGKLAPSFAKIVAYLRFKDVQMCLEVFENTVVYILMPWETYAPHRRRIFELLRCWRSIPVHCRNSSVLCLENQKLQVKLDHPTVTIGQFSQHGYTCLVALDLSFQKSIAMPG